MGADVVMGSFQLRARGSRCGSGAVRYVACDARALRSAERGYVPFASMSDLSRCREQGGDDD